MNHASVFTGIGGFDIAAEWVGWNNIFACEKDKYLREKLKLLFPELSEIYDDIKTTDFTIWEGKIDILTGGDPCQPHSVAGLGKGEADDRYLWPEMFRAVQEIRPAFVVNENVAGSLSNGIVDIKISHLESEGYACQAYCIPASAVGAMHQRERVWIVAYNSDYKRRVIRRSKEFCEKTEKEGLQKRNEIQQTFEPVTLWDQDTDPDPDIERLELQYFTTKPDIRPEGLSGNFGIIPYAYGNITRYSLESGIIRMLDGISEGMDYTERYKRLKALGNAVVPQVVYEIFRGIEIKTTS